MKKPVFQALNVFKKKNEASLSRRPENDKDRKKLLVAIVEAHKNGDITDPKFEILHKKAKHDLSHLEVVKIAQQASTVAAILSAVAAASGVILNQVTSEGEQDDSKDDEAGSHDAEELDDAEDNDDADPGI